MPSEPLIAIINHQSDSRWAELIRAQLFVFERQALLRLWYPGGISPGTEWDLATAATIEDADVAIVLLSPDFLNSGVFQRYWTRLLDRRNTERLLLFSVVVRETNWPDIEGLAAQKVWPNDGKALGARPQRTVDGVIAALVDEVARVAGELVEAAAQEGGNAAPPATAVVRPNVFISHSKADRHFAESMKDKLEKAGFHPWYDSERLKAGSDWRREIDEALQGTSVVVVVMSPDAQASDYVTYEWAFACGLGIPVIPVLLRPTALHPRLATVQYLDFRRVQRWSSLTSRLREILETT